MEFLSFMLYSLAALVFIGGMIAVNKEKQKYINRPADWHFKQKELIKSITFITLILLIGGCWASPAAKTTPVDQTTQTAAVATVDTTIARSPDTLGGSNWKYKEDVDPMTNVTDYYAMLESPSVLDLKFPYNGGAVPTLTVRYQSHHNRVYLSVDKGQFMPPGDDGGIRVKFDNGKPIIFTCTEPSDGSSNTLFIDDAGRFITKLKHSKSLMIQALFYDNGRQTMEFGTQLLKWEH